MRNFIRNIIDRLRGFIRADAHDTTEPTVNDSTHPIPDEADFDVDHSRSSIVVLTPSGIRFKGLRYNSPAVAEMLLRMKSGDRVKVRIKDPSDASSIFVWDSSARPTPRWITVGIADAPTKLSFAQHARLRDFARKQELAFSMEAERSEALERLKQHWKKLAEQPPIGESRQQLRAVDLSNPTEDEAAIADILKRPRGRRPSKPAIYKAKRTRHARRSRSPQRPPGDLPTPKASNAKEYVK
jgi:hypothetical protein